MKVYLKALNLLNEAQRWIEWLESQPIQAQASISSIPNRFEYAALLESSTSRVNFYKHIELVKFFLVDLLQLLSFNLDNQCHLLLSVESWLNQLIPWLAVVTWSSKNFSSAVLCFRFSFGFMSSKQTKTSKEEKRTFSEKKTSVLLKLNNWKYPTRDNHAVSVWLHGINNKNFYWNYNVV